MAPFTIYNCFRYSGHRANRVNAIVVKQNVCKELVWKREAKHTLANNAALKDSVLDDLLTEK